MAIIDTQSGLRLSGDAAGMNTAVLRNFRTETKDGAGSTPNVPRMPIDAYISSVLTNQVHGLYRFKNHIIAVCEDGYVYRITDAVPTLPIALSLSTDATSIALGNGTRPVFAEDPSDVFIATGGFIYKWTDGGLTVSSITTSNAPISCTHVSYIGQRLVANDRSSAANKQRFFYSDLGDGSDSTWGALSFQTAEGRPDEVVAVYENTSELFVFGESTIQVFGISEDPNAPFSPQNTINLGLHAYYSPVLVDNQFAFIDNQRRIVMSDGRAIDPISEDLDTWLAANTISDAWGWREKSGGWDLLFYQFPTAHRTFAYNLKTKQWYEDTRYNGATVDLMPINAYAYRKLDNVHLFGSSIASAIYKRGTAQAADRATDTVVCERMTGVHRFGTWKRKRSNRITCVMRRGTSGPSGTSDVFEVRVRDDGGDWSEWDQIEIGNDGDSTQAEPVFLSGVFVGRQYHFRYTGTDSTALIEAHDDVQELDS